MKATIGRVESKVMTMCVEFYERPYDINSFSRLKFPLLIVIAQKFSTEFKAA